MLKAEAKWLAAQLSAIEDLQLFPLLNVGCHTKQFRAREQPWVDRYLFSKLEARGRVIHTDLREGDGIDVVGDLTDAKFIGELHDLGVRSVMCCNVLEHVPDRDSISAALNQVAAPGGMIVASVPHRFPYHPDPIDTLYRPSPNELADQFPGTLPRALAVVDAGGFVTMVWNKVTMAPLAFASAALDRRRYHAGDAAVGQRGESWLPWIGQSFQVSCAVLEKLPAAA